MSNAHVNGHQKEPMHDIPVYSESGRWFGAIRVHVRALVETLARPGREIRITEKTGLIIPARMSDQFSNAMETIGYCEFRLDRWQTPPRIELPELEIINGRVVFVLTTTDRLEDVRKTQGYRELSEAEIYELSPR